MSKSIIINLNIEVETPYTDDNKAIEYANNIELPEGYQEDTFEIVKIIDNN